MIQSALISSAQQSPWTGGVGQNSAYAQESGNVGRGRSGGEAGSARSTAVVSGELTLEEQRVVRQLEQIDRNVRAHEQAHLSVGADLVRGGPSYSYETGPDERRYAVSGEVSIDVSPGKSPQETIPKAQHIRSTALAPADPSAQDYRVAAAASQMEIDARMSLAQQESDGIRSELAESGETDSAGFYRAGQISDYSSERVGRYFDAFA